MVKGRHIAEETKIKEMKTRITLNPVSKENVTTAGESITGRFIVNQKRKENSMMAKTSLMGATFCG